MDLRSIPSSRRPGPAVSTARESAPRDRVRPARRAAVRLGANLVLLALVLPLAAAQQARGQEEKLSGRLLVAAEASPRPSATPAAGAAAEATAAPRDYYVRARGYRVVPDTDPPRYVRDAARTGIGLLEDLSWLDLGFEHRMRFEYRDNSFLRTPQAGQDYPFLLRTRAFLGVKKILDPFRMSIEVQDSQWENSIYPNTNREVNQVEPIQLYGELYFDDAFGSDRPLYVRGGRMAFELVDRRLIANNEFRNTTNNFQGVRAHWGKMTSDWDLDLLAMQPIDRLLYDFDETFEDLWLYGFAGTWRRWSEVATLQPYWFGLSQGSTDAKPRGNFAIQTTGARAYGVVGQTGWDWDVDLVYQFGDWIDGQKQRAGAAALEVGYTVEDWSWKPRFSAFLGYGTGDRDPDDDVNNSFNSLYGFNQPWSRNDYFSWDNAIQPKARLEFTPVKDMLVDLGYGAFWLASAKAAWQRAQLRDPTGQSGTFLGNEFDARVRYKVFGRVTFDVSYSRFNPGGFPKKLGKPLASNFVYFQVTLNALE
ncbi:MAG: alginate export family protein [Deltaproteobacteria bacterium]|nr:alginate export family protein [Deltaproteobacteria bacterium]